VRTVHSSIQNLFQTNTYFVPRNARQIPSKDAGSGGLQIEPLSSTENFLIRSSGVRHSAVRQASGRNA
jgi:hypothetical protein